MPVGDVLTTYGKPQYVWCVETGDSEPCVGSVTLLYLERGLAYGLGMAEPCGGDFPIDARLGATSYAQFVTGTLDEVLKGICHLNDAGVAQAHTELRAWTGYESMKRAVEK